MIPSKEEEKILLNMHSRINSVTGEFFGQEQAYAKILKEYKEDPHHIPTKTYILLRESARDGLFHVDQGELSEGTFKITTIPYAIDLKVLNAMLKLMQYKTLVPAYGEGLYERVYDASPLSQEDAKNQPRMLMTRPSGLFMNHSPFFKSLTTKEFINKVTKEDKESKNFDMRSL